MPSPPAVRYGGVLVISEGPDRLQWQRVSRAGWVPERLWPDEHEAAHVRRRLAHGHPILVLVHGMEAAVPLLDEQLTAAPAELQALVREAPRDLPTLRIPALDWLPADLRRRGLRFLRQTALQLARRPPALRPPLTLEDPDLAVPHLRFAYRAGSYPNLSRDLPAIVEHAFTGLPRLAVA